MKIFRRTRRIFVFGSDYPGDELAYKLAKQISTPKGFRFHEKHDPSDLIKEKRLIIMDVAKGIDKISIIEDLDMVKRSHISTAHDFDLGFFLKLYGAIHKQKITIIALPEKTTPYQLEQFFKENHKKII